MRGSVLILILIFSLAAVQHAGCQCVAARSRCTSSNGMEAVRQACEGIAGENCTAQVDCHCKCLAPFGGADCNACAPGFLEFPQCRQCRLADTANVSLTEECSDDQDRDLAVCRAFAVSAILTPEECAMEGSVEGLGPESWCSKAHRMYSVMDSLYTANLLDMIFVLLSLGPAVLMLGTSWPSEPKLRGLAIGASLLIFSVDFALQVGSLVFSFSSANADAGRLLEANCLNNKGNSILVDFREGLKSLRVLGVIELAVCLTGLAIGVLAAVDVEGTRLCLIDGLELLTCLLDIVLSVIEFAAFTLDTREKATVLYDAMGGGTLEGVTWCTAAIEGEHRGHCFASAAAKEEVTGATGVLFWMSLIAAILSCVPCYFALKYERSRRATLPSDLLLEGSILSSPALCWGILASLQGGGVSVELFYASVWFVFGTLLVSANLEVLMILDHYEHDHPGWVIVMVALVMISSLGAAICAGFLVAQVQSS